MRLALASLLALASCATASHRDRTAWLEVIPEFACFAPCHVSVTVHSTLPLGCSPVAYVWGDGSEPETVTPTCLHGLVDGSINRSYVYQSEGEFEAVFVIALPGEARPRYMRHTTVVR